MEKQCGAIGCTAMFIVRNLKQIRCVKCHRTNKKYRDMTSKNLEKYLRRKAKIKEQRKKQPANIAHAKKHHLKRLAQGDKSEAYLELIEKIKINKWAFKKTLRCAHCACEKNLTVDHIIPLSKGGGGEAKNLQILCWDCNQVKGDSII